MCGKRGEKKVYLLIFFLGCHFLLVHHQLGVHRCGQDHPVEVYQKEAQDPGADQVEQGQPACRPSSKERLPGDHQRR